METTKRSFRAARQLKLHQRAVDVLDMIVSCDKRYADKSDHLTKWDASRWFDPIRLMYEREELANDVNKYAAIKQRLTGYYIDIMKRINDVAIEYLTAQESDLLLQEKLS